MSARTLVLNLGFALPKGYKRRFIWQDGKSRIVLSYSKNLLRYHSVGMPSNGLTLSRSLDWMQEVDAQVRYDALSQEAPFE